MSNDCFEKFSKQSLVFYSSSNKNIIKKLLNNREPTNICMKSLFNEIQIKNDFNYEISYYSEYFQKFNKIAPNIGVYTFLHQYFMKINILIVIFIMQLDMLLIIINNQIIYISKNIILIKYYLLIDI